MYRFIEKITDVGGFPIQGFAGNGGTPPPGQVDVVKKLFETTVTTPVNSITATIDPVENFVDYAEFWLIVTGSLSAEDDIFAQMNDFTSSAYGTLFSRLKSDVTTAVFASQGDFAWNLNNAPNSEPLRANEQFYAKITLQGGIIVDSTIHGVIHSTVRATGAGNSPSGIIGHIELQESIGTTLFNFIVLTGGTANFNVGTKVSVYGVATE